MPENYKTKKTHAYCSLANIITSVKSNRIRRTGHEVRMGEMTNPYRTLTVNLKERKHLEDLFVEGRIMLNCIL
jgi:hypothetical protein